MIRSTVVPIFSISNLRSAFVAKVAVIWLQSPIPVTVPLSWKRSVYVPSSHSTSCAIICTSCHSVPISARIERCALRQLQQPKAIVAIMMSVNENKIVRRFGIPFCGYSLGCTFKFTPSYNALYHPLCFLDVTLESTLRCTHARTDTSLAPQ